MSTKAEKIKSEIYQSCRQRNKASKQLNEKAGEFLPGGDTRSVCLYKPYPTYIAEGRGCCVYDVDGNE